MNNHTLGINGLTQVTTFVIEFYYSSYVHFVEIHKVNNFNLSCVLALLFPPYDASTATRRASTR